MLRLSGRALCTGGSTRVASNLPISSEGSSIFSVGRSSMGMKSLSALTGSGISSLGSVTSVLAVFSSSATTALGVSSSLFTDGSATVSFSFFSAFSAVFFPSALVLRGRPGLRLVDSVVSSVSFVLSTVGWAGTTAVFSMVGASFGLGLLSSPFLSAENTLSTLSFLTVTRDLFWRSFLRSSFCLSAATFLVAPTMACSSRIL